MDGRVLLEAGRLRVRIARGKRRMTSAAQDVNVGAFTKMMGARRRQRKERRPCRSHGWKMVSEANNEIDAAQRTKQSWPTRPIGRILGGQSENTAGNDGKWRITASEA